MTCNTFFHQVRCIIQLHGEFVSHPTLNPGGYYNVFYCLKLSCTPRMTKPQTLMESVKLSVEFWKDRWDQGRATWHEFEGNNNLKQNFDTFVNGRKALKIFVPLCGKAFDMKWIAEQGHTVVGVEVAEKAILEFFTGNCVPFKRKPVLTLPAGEVFRSLDGNISIYCCNIFDISKDVLGLFDGIWDRGSLVAINIDDRQRYVSLMLSLMAPGCNYLLETFIFDPMKHSGPPHAIDDDTLEEMYGTTCKIQHLSKKNELRDKQWQLGLDY
uniref:thiopurine S-methyltransferase n=1 Tax=Eptatretus burgeri TaxID=7764 RepID=A0A8C4NIT2_EPTBU